jgi:hypothetical protein
MWDWRNKHTSCFFPCLLPFLFHFAIFSLFAWYIVSVHTVYKGQNTLLWPLCVCFHHISTEITGLYSYFIFLTLLQSQVSCLCVSHFGKSLSWKVKVLLKIHVVTAPRSVICLVHLPWHRLYAIWMARVQSLTDKLETFSLCHHIQNSSGAYLVP